MKWFNVSAEKSEQLNIDFFGTVQITVLNIHYGTKKLSTPEEFLHIAKDQIKQHFWVQTSSPVPSHYAFSFFNI